VEFDQLNCFEAFIVYAVIFFCSFLRYKLSEVLVWCMCWHLKLLVDARKSIRPVKDSFTVYFNSHCYLLSGILNPHHSVIHPNLKTPGN